jgi:acyl-CoA thioester hydrolase|tara:strand:- start:76 stop:486 length:411 start_codon:yes stop_codon:yes gene_type:complete
MVVSTCKIRVRYAETDQMGYCYYGNYPGFLEMGRVEALRELGIRYRDLEEKGIMLPVSSLEIKYKIPIRYDEHITVETKILNLPEGTRILFSYQIFNENGDLATTAEVVLVSASVETGRPQAMPKEILNVLKPYFL